jgi:hypothetical protein
VLGDLWPGSVWVEEGGGLVWIDWEFSSWGYPEQDVGHLWAHLMLLGREELASRFWEAWAGEAQRGWSAEQVWLYASRHGACEVLSRTIGAFGEGGELDEGARRLVQRAVELLEGG